MVFNKTEVDFGCILNDIEVMKLAYMTNPGPLPVKYAWYFINRPPIVRGKDSSDEGVDMESDYDSPEEEIPHGGNWEEGEEEKVRGGKDEYGSGEVEDKKDSAQPVMKLEGEQLDGGGLGKGIAVSSKTDVAMESGDPSSPKTVKVVLKGDPGKLEGTEGTISGGPQKLTVTEEAISQDPGTLVTMEEMASGDSKVLAEPEALESGASEEAIKPTSTQQSPLTSTSTASATAKVKKVKKKKKKFQEVWRNAKDPFKPIPISQVSINCTLPTTMHITNKKSLFID